MSPEEYKAHREKLGLTQAGLAALLGVTRATINAREAGRTGITREIELALLALETAPVPGGAGEGVGSGHHEGPLRQLVQPEPAADRPEAAE